MMMIGIGLTFPFISYNDMCGMEFSEIQSWYAEAKNHQEKLEEIRNG